MNLTAMHAAGFILVSCCENLKFNIVKATFLLSSNIKSDWKQKSQSNISYVAAYTAMEPGQLGLYSDDLQSGQLRSKG
jgi:hypothetical protein